MQPPAFCTGSRNTAATVSGPSNSMASAIRSAAHCPNALMSVCERFGRAVEIGIGHPHAAGGERLERRLVLRQHR